jgi:O-antigen ligase
MLANVTALVFVLALAMPAFYIARRTVSPFISSHEFSIWRNSWFAATIAAFLSGNFFVFAAVVAAICIYARFLRAASVGLFFVLLFAAPLINVAIEGFGGINKLFELNNGRLLAIALLLPILFFKRRPKEQYSNAYATPDWLVVTYVLLLIVLQFRQSDVTNVMRVAVVQSLDILVPYFAFSRAVTSISDFRRALLGLVVGVIPLSLVALTEVVKGWHLYGGIATDWGSPFEYIRREGLLRASGSAGGGITLGYVLMAALGCALGFWHRSNPSRKFVGITLIFLSAGLIVSLSRGPWVGALVMIVVFLAIGPQAMTNLGKLVVVGVTVTPLLLTPIGDKVINMLPFVGGVDVQNVDYRERLFESAMTVIERNPWIGSSDYYQQPEMQAMRQGEGIIDTVNTYLQIALDSGLIGLGLFLSFFATILAGLWRVTKLKFGAEQNLNFSIKTYASAAFATLIGILVTIGTTSSIDFVPYVYWSLAGLSVALIRIAYAERAALVGAVRATRYQQMQIIRKPDRERTKFPTL